MTIVSPDTASRGSGSGGARSTLLVSPKKRELKTYQRRRSLGGASGLSRQEDATNREHPDGPPQETEMAVVDVALPPSRVGAPQEPAKSKRGRRDASWVEITWAAKKQRSTVAAAAQHGSAIAEVNGAAPAPASSLIVQELAGPESICKKDKRSPGGGSGAFMVERKDEKLRSCRFTAPAPAPDGACADWEVTALGRQLPLPSVQLPARHHHQSDEETCWPIKKRCPGTAVDCEGGDGVMDQVSPSTPPLRIQEPTPVREAKAASCQCCKTKKHYDCKIMKQPFMSLSSRLQCMGITNVTTVLTKVLTPTDCNLNQSRLLLQPSLIVDSPLMIMLTPSEDQAVHRERNMDGLQLEAFDRHGHSYNMTFKFLECNCAYRLIGEWSKFLAQNGVCSGDMFELGAFRFEGRLVLTLMHHAKEDRTHEERKVAESSKEVQITKEEGNEGAAEEQTSGEIEAAEGAEEKWTREEMEAAAIMMELSDFKDGKRL